LPQIILKIKSIATDSQNKMKKYLRAINESAATNLKEFFTYFLEM
jgi:hypothetical protein